MRAAQRTRDDGVVGRVRPRHTASLPVPVHPVHDRDTRGGVEGALEHDVEAGGALHRPRAYIHTVVAGLAQGENGLVVGRALGVHH
jgi:hypothetical protein